MLILATLVSALGCSDDRLDWPRFRGPNGTGVATQARVPSDVTAEPTWRIPLAPGSSSPVLAGDHVLLTTYDDATLRVRALNREDGSFAWSHDIARDRAMKVDRRNDPASPSIAADHDTRVAFFPEHGLVALEPDGRLRWERRLGPFDNVYGMGASPILVDDLVILPCDQNQGSFLLACSKLDGSDVWRSDRPEATSGHCTPVVRRRTGHPTELILPGSFLLDAYDVSDGRRTWWVRGLSFEMKSTPVLHDDTIFINGYGSPLNQPGKQIPVDPFDVALAAQDADGNRVFTVSEMPEGLADWFDFVDLDHDKRLDAGEWRYLRAALSSLNGFLAIRAGGEGDRTDEQVLWSYRRAVPQLPSPLLVDGTLYLLADGGGLLTTFDPATGAVRERGRVEEAVDAFYASPVAGDGKVVLLSLGGLLVVLPSDGTCEPLSVRDLDEACPATPALGPDGLFVRSQKALYRFSPPE